MKSGENILGKTTQTNNISFHLSAWDCRRAEFVQNISTSVDFEISQTPLDVRKENVQILQNVENDEMVTLHEVYV